MGISATNVRTAIGVGVGAAIGVGVTKLLDDGTFFDDRRAATLERATAKQLLDRQHRGEASLTKPEIDAAEHRVDRNRIPWHPGFSVGLLGSIGVASIGGGIAIANHGGALKEAVAGTVATRSATVGFASGLAEYLFSVGGAEPISSRIAAGLLPVAGGILIGGLAVAATAWGAHLLRRD